eukprot:gene13272-4105_t
MQPEKHSHSTSKGEDLPPVVRVAISHTAAPWVIVEEVNKTHTDREACGRTGMLGEKFVNGTDTVKICAYGYVIDLLNLLKTKLLFEAVISTSRDGKFGSYDIETGDSDGIVREVLENKADIGIDLTENKGRSTALWFSNPHLIAPISIAYIQGNSFDESSIFGPFSKNLYIGIIGMIVGLVVIVFVIERVSPYSGFQIRQRSFVDMEDFGAFDSTTYVWGTLFTGEIIEKKPKSSGSRTMVLAFSFVSVVIISAYSGNLITYLVVLDERPPVSGLLDPKIFTFAFVFQRTEARIYGVFEVAANESIFKEALIKMNVSTTNASSYFAPNLSLSQYMDQGNDIAKELNGHGRSGRYLVNDFSNVKNEIFREILNNDKINKTVHADNKFNIAEKPEKHSHSTSKDEDLESVVRVVIASTYSPWVIVEEICETHITGRKACGLIGMLGEKYVNGTNTVKICVYGYAIDLLNRLRKNLNFEAVIYTSRDGRYGSYDLETGETDGIRDSFDESSIFGPFSDNLWFGIIGLIAGLVVTIYITEHVSPYSGFQIKKRSFDDIKDFGAFDSTTYVWGTLFTGEIIEKKPKSSGSRTMVLAFSFVSVVIISAYSGNLITYLVVLDERPPVSGLFVPKKDTLQNAGLDESLLKLAQGFIYMRLEVKT